MIKKYQYTMTCIQTKNHLTHSHSYMHATHTKTQFHTTNKNTRQETFSRDNQAGNELGFQGGKQS